MGEALWLKYKTFINHLFRLEFLAINRMSSYICMTFYSCFDGKGNVIARCQTNQEVEVLKRMGRPIVEVREMKKEEAIICSLTSSPSDFNLDY